MRRLTYAALVVVLSWILNCWTLRALNRKSEKKRLDHATRTRHKLDTSIGNSVDQVVTGGSNLKPTELVKFFRVNGMCPDQEFRDDVTAHVEAFGRNQDRDGFVKFVRCVNRTVETFAKQFKYNGEVAKTLNRVLVKTRSHDDMLPTALTDKLRGEVSFQELQADGSVKKYTTKNPVLACIVQEFTFFLCDFSIDKCGFDDDVVEFAKTYYLPDDSAELFPMLRTHCGIGRAVEATTNDADAIAGPSEPAAIAISPNQIEVDLTVAIRDDIRAESTGIDTNAGNAADLSLDVYEAMILKGDSFSTPPLCEDGGPNYVGFDDSAQGSSESADSSDQMDEDSVSFDKIAGMAPTHSSEYGIGGGSRMRLHPHIDPADTINPDDVLGEFSESRVTIGAKAQSLRAAHIVLVSSTDDLETARATRTAPQKLRNTLAPGTTASVGSLSVAHNFAENAQSVGHGSTNSVHDSSPEVFSPLVSFREAQGTAQELQESPSPCMSDGRVPSDSGSSDLSLKGFRVFWTTILSTMLFFTALGIGAALGHASDGFTVGIVFAVLGAVVGAAYIGVAWFCENKRWLLCGSILYTVSMVVGLIVGLGFESDRNHEPSGFQAGITIAVLLVVVAAGCAVRLCYLQSPSHRRLCLQVVCLQALISALVIGLAIGLTQESGTDHEAGGLFAGLYISGVLAIIGVFLALKAAMASRVEGANGFRKTLTVASVSVLVVAIVIGLAVGLSMRNKRIFGWLLASAMFLTTVYFGSFVILIARNRSRADLQNLHYSENSLQGSRHSEELTSMPTTSEVLI
eukprot:m.29109 g.29109  ORF g.29109 m.29109 type:complete len:799 (+) comp6644_c0_seq1:326-2722(+)